MAQPQTAIQVGPVTSLIAISSLDRYSNGVPPAASSNQTSCTDLTFSLPGLSNIATVIVNSVGVNSNNTWYSQGATSNAASAAFYTNLINLIDYTSGTTYLVTIPTTNASLTVIISQLGKYAQASTYGGSAAAGANPLITGTGVLSNYDPIAGAASLNTWWWYDAARSPNSNTHSLGWGRVTTAPDGTNIANRRQLYDLLGLANHVPSVAGLGGYGVGYTTCQYQPIQLYSFQGPFRYVSIISPQLTNFAPDVSTNSNAPPNELCRLILPSMSANSSIGGSLQSKIMKVAPGTTSLRIQVVDDQGNVLPSNYPVPAPYQGAPTAGVGILSTTLSNLTFSGISNANVTFPAGTQVSIVTTSGSAAGWNPGVYQVQSSTSNTVVIPYLTTSSNQISNASYGFTIQPVWQTSLAGNQNGPEYTINLIGIARTTNA
jgi:hypothetical protein